MKREVSAGNFAVDAGTLVAFLLATCSLASAQVSGVMDRSRAAFDPKGIPLGGFRIFPKLDLDAGYDDNVFRLPGAQSDWYVRQTPSLRVQSEWGRHFLEIFGGADNYNYSRFSSLNLTDWNVGAAGRYDIMRGAAVSATTTYGEYHEALYSPNTVGNQISPNKYHKEHSDVTATYQPGRIGVAGGLSFDRLTYANAPLLGGGIVNNADRNEDEYEAYVRGLYDFSPGYTVFVKGSYDSRTFDQALDRSGYHRASNGLRFDGGLDLQLSNLIDGEIYAGYLEQHYAQNVALPLKNISGLDFGGQLNWYATPLLTVHLSGAHLVSDVVLTGVSASEDELGKLSGDYELGYNLIAQAYGSYTHSHLQGSVRTDDYPSAGVNLRYLMNEYLSANVGYDYGERSSNAIGADYTDNMITFRVTGHI